jgi:hypothetical protein
MDASFLAGEGSSMDNTFEHLSVDAGDLIEALTGSPDEGDWMLDLESGEVILAAPEEVTGVPEDEDWADPDRFLAIQPMGSREACQIMADFVAGLPDGEPGRALGRALATRHPFSSFKDALPDFPELEERWRSFHESRMLDYAQEWLEENLPDASLEVPAWLRRKHPVAPGPGAGA